MKGLFAHCHLLEFMRLLLRHQISACSPELQWVFLHLPRLCDFQDNLNMRFYLSEEIFGNSVSTWCFMLSFFSTFVARDIAVCKYDAFLCFCTFLDTRLYVYTVRSFLFFLLCLSTLMSAMGPLSCFAQNKTPERNVASIFTGPDYIVCNYLVFRTGLTGLSGIAHISQSVLLSHS